MKILLGTALACLISSAVFAGENSYDLVAMAQEVNYEGQPIELDEASSMPPNICWNSMARCEYYGAGYCPTNAICKEVFSPIHMYCLHLCAP